MPDLRIRAGLVVPVGGPEVDGGVVEVTGDRISHVGVEPTPGRAREEVHEPAMLVIPGLVNTHCHTNQQLARGLADDVDLLTWLRDRIWPYEAALTEADAEVSALACALEQIRSGVTLLAEPGGRHVDAMVRALTTAGIRGVVGLSAMDQPEGVPPSMAQPAAELLALQEDLVRRHHGSADGRIRASYGVRTIFSCSDELITGSVERAERDGTFVHMHVAEVPEENDHVRATRGTTTVRHLDRLGALGPRLLAVHCVWLDDEELDLLAGTRTGISHNVASNLKILGFPRIADLLDRGAVVGLGTDGAPSNNRMSVIDEMWAASMVQKALRRDPAAMPARQVLHMATLGGATALGLGDELGSLEPGKAADLVLVDPRTVNMTPLHDPVSALVTSMKTENVDSVLCAGRWVMRGRRIVGLDEPSVLAEAQARAERLRPPATRTSPRGGR